MASVPETSTPEKEKKTLTPEELKLKLRERVVTETGCVRSIGRWYIGETLGKGGYSWVKRGYDKKTGRCVALKFMARADASWREEQEKQVVTEIESLKKVRHKHVMKLYAYNLSAKYPQKEGGEMDAILLVLELSPGGELFDILYYTSALEPILARTYFRQMAAGLQACHKAGVCHRDLKPQNLLLDSKFNLKITDFGLSKVFHSDAEAVMRTTYVGTRGYQAPELLLSRPFDVSCDIFSAGVILFILLTGYPPFEQAMKTDRWYRPIAKGDLAKFWELHAGSPVSDDAAVQALITSMLAYDPKKRASLAEVMASEWFGGKHLEGKDLVRVLRVRHKKMESKRRKDVRKMTDLVTSVEKSRAIKGMEDVLEEPAPLYPADGIEGVWDAYSTVEDWKHIYNVIHDVVMALGGAAEFDFEEKTLECTLALVDESDLTGKRSVVKFVAKVFRSRVYPGIHAVRVRRKEGSALHFRRVFSEVLLLQCAGVLTGLPKEFRKTMSSLVEEADEAGSDADEVGDDYDAMLASEGIDGVYLAAEESG